LDGEQHAALEQRPVADHRAGPAVTRVAADMRAGETEVVTDEVHEQPSRRDLALVTSAVDLDVDGLRADDLGGAAFHSASPFLRLVDRAHGEDLGEVTPVLRGGMYVRRGIEVGAAHRF